MTRIRNFVAATMLIAAGLLTFGAQSASAGGEYMAEPPHTAMPWGPGWMVRVRGLGVLPDEDSSGHALDGTPIVAGIKIDDSIVPELDISYFFTPNIAAELILAVTPHDIDGTGALGGSIGDAWLLPPTLLLQYHFNPGGAFKPYIGAGVNYTIFFNEDASNQTLTAGLTTSDLELDDEFGFALQAGVDIHLRGNMYLNLDVKKIFLDTDATVRTVQGGPNVNVVTTHVDIDPLVVGVGLGWKL